MNKTNFVFGCDTSKWQDDKDTPEVIDYAVMKAAGARFAGVKSWQGYATDRAFAVSWVNAKAQGLPRFAYCYWDSTVNMATQFINFFNIIKDDPGEMPQALDLEALVPRDKMIAAMRQFEKLYTDRGMRARYGHNPMLYTNPNILLNYLKPVPADLLLKYDLFVAAYPVIPDTADPVSFIRQSTIEPRTGEFPSWRFWQFSADGNKQGKRFGAESRDIDIDIFNGDEATFAAYLGETVRPEPSDAEKLAILWAEYKTRNNL